VIEISPSATNQYLSVPAGVSLAIKIAVMVKANVINKIL
jgi:hypothetical protein